MTLERALRSAVGMAVVVALAGLQAGCAERIGKKAAAGAIAELQRQHDENPDRRPAKVAAASAVEGVVEALGTPERQAQIDRLVSRAAAVAAQTAVQEATRQMVVSLGPDGQGPLASSLSRIGQQIGHQVVTNAVDDVGAQLAALVPECTGPDPLACVERRLQRTAHGTAASFTSGVKESIGWQVLLVAFALGAGGGVLGAWLWSLRHFRRRSLRLA
ncbi:MAG TPA: hypothetical protein VKQ32_14125 [Polyangia bacterium]|nr:hypothetical protein [Polyangia bacterium]